MAEETKEEVQSKKGGKKKLLIFILLGFFIVGLAGAGAFLFLGKKGEEDKTAHSKKSKEKKQAFYVDFDPIIVNLLDPSGKRFLQVKITLEVPDQKLEEEIKKKEAIVKDTIISTLSGKTVEEVIVPEAKENLKKELLAKINERLGEEVISNIYITQYIVE